MNPLPVNGDEFIDQIRDVQERVAEVQQDATGLALPQQSRLLESLERLRKALQDLQVADEAIRLLLSAVQQSRDSIIITTAKLDPPGPEIVYVNPAFTQMTGYAAEEVLGKTPRLLQGPGTDRAVLKDLRAHLDSAEPYHGEAINYHKDGTPFFVEWNIAPICNAQEEVTHFVAIQRDISDRKRLEQEREYLLAQEKLARREAEAASRTKDQFLATLSHELRTPLTPILGWSKVLREKQLPPDKAEAALQTIEENAKRQAQLVDDLLDLSRITQGKLVLDLDLIPLTEPILAALATVRPAADAKSIQIYTNLDENIAPIRGDLGRLQQVFWNLLSNAIKFTLYGGRITVKLEQIGHDAQITIADTGQGIQPEFLPFVFDLFRQQDSSITRQFGGLGLGLSLCRQLIEAHGGTITVESAGEAQGATFTICLPVVLDKSTDLLQPVSPGKPNLAGVRVLVVDDEPATLEFVAFVLEQADAIVTAVSSAQEALAALSEFKFDVLVSDIGMQGVDGLTLLRRLRALTDSPNCNIAAIALTAYATQKNQEQALANGYQHHLAKPFEPDMLINAVAEMVHRAV